MNISHLKNKNIHLVECENWQDVYGYEKSEMKEGIIKYIEQLQQENEILKENAEHNDKVVDKVNFENQLLKKENKQLKAQIEEYQKALDETMSEKMDIENNWNKLKEHIEKDYGFYDKLIAPEYGCVIGALSRIKDKMHKLEKGSDSNE